MIKLLTISYIFGFLISIASATQLEKDFKTPPDSARPGVYWYFMDGNLSRTEMTADLESMKKVGLGNLVFLEVNVGVPRGPVDFMSDEWQGLFAHAVHEAERLGIDITLGSGPGWAGSGGPWGKPEQAMQHLLFSVVETKGPAKFDAVLPVPEQRPTTWGKRLTDFYEDLIVYAFPRRNPIITNVNEKALYERNPYTSKPGVKPYLPTTSHYIEPGPDEIISSSELVDISDNLKPGGRLQWDVPAGDWTIVRMVRRATCAETRPAPKPGLGLECDKFDAAALEAHLANYYDKLLKKIGPRKDRHGWTAVHIDSWEMGAQNWTKNFLAEFKKRRGYDAKPYLLAYTGRAVGGLERSERFLWDVRLTAQELVLENHAGHLKKLGRRHGFELSIEPYDMNPTADLELGAVADVPMCEFWSDGLGYDSSFSCIEATSVAHTMGRPIVAAEAFTAGGAEKWRQYPWSMKNQGDWAFCIGINRFVYHTFAHKPLGEAYRPGMTMGPYGVHWDRGQTWWPMVKSYHEYVSRCSHLMRQGVTVSDILYLTPEGAPHVFRAPASALDGVGLLADKKGYGFDGCSPGILMAKANVQNGRIAFPGGTSYRLMVLPQVETMTPELLTKIESLIKAGATVVGVQPVKSPSLSNYPQCDTAVSELAKNIWGGLNVPKEITKRQYGQGTIYYGGAFSVKSPVVIKSILPQSTWIWYPEGNPPPAGTRYFRRKITVDKNKTLLSARSAITADNSFILWINGKQVDRGGSFRVINEKQITNFLHPGENILAIAATNGGPEANPAGLIAAFELNYKDGSKDLIHTDASWHTGLKETPDWKILPSVPAGWKKAVVLGGLSMKPWGLSAPDSIKLAELYPHYDDTAALLKQMDISEDFVSTGPIRYGHRRTDRRDIYFVSNKTSEPVESDCTFRVAEGRPQLWHPVTGQRRFLPQYKTENGQTTIPLKFAPYESFFIVFSSEDSPTTRSEAAAVNFQKTIPVAELQGAWQVCFDPKWGGPEKTTFETLIDWTQSSTRGIKYYSGIATYRKTFKLPAGIDTDSKIYLDLGTVHDMARV
ncbi:MAG: hypothetical protein JXM70_26745, partial [Pirellulales bacterium]|nr:hypothetical protein [Pirellulales bacterium]